MVSDFEALKKVISVSSGFQTFLRKYRCDRIGNDRHRSAGLLRQSTCGCLAGYGHVNDPERTCRDPGMRGWSATRRSPPWSPWRARRAGAFETRGGSSPNQDELWRRLLITSLFFFGDRSLRQQLGY